MAPTIPVVVLALVPSVTRRLPLLQLLGIYCCRRSSSSSFCPHIWELDIEPAATLTVPTIDEPRKMEKTIMTVIIIRNNSPALFCELHNYPAYSPFSHNTYYEGIAMHKK